ncbi:hypothetical protein VOLCADRAFT_108306 [Volvox carteri f. nagariensis]|uniref:Uncharacterized protein n=1 Tax=Volvox carteri f. nagariensis TaxID=3068 RepID=D8UJD4_VOLCA|nr:uncharacterized protein VOLCADRAFT_108306 [Volvox carteri f. nagariensis]EFJ40168.1 hypothetical protein VOLCADRAFT_108306 [Volvox carteri f. nagariensis]|eukprot:XP_002958778.1 hypothetical protein VOLCADRAFT_108306 [Volvox carteri f. nagariensis]
MVKIINGEIVPGFQVLSRQATPGDPAQQRLEGKPGAAALASACKPPRCGSFLPHPELSPFWACQMPRCLVYGSHRTPYLRQLPWACSSDGAAPWWP